MEQTWRWFGEQDPITLDHVRQAGATGIVTALHHVPSGRAWPAAEIADRQATVAAAGLNWSVCELIPVPDAVKLGGAGARPVHRRMEGFARRSRPCRHRRRLLQFHAGRRLDAHRSRLAIAVRGIGAAVRYRRFRRL